MLEGSKGLEDLKNIFKYVYIYLYAYKCMFIIHYSILLYLNLLKYEAIVYELL